MKKNALAIFILLSALSLFAVDPDYRAPVKLEDEIMEKFIELVPELEVKEVKKHINCFMFDLTHKYYNTRLDPNLAPSSCVQKVDDLYPIICNTCLTDAIQHIQEAPNVNAKLDIILDFCEGYNDGIRYLEGDFSALQIIKYGQLTTFRAALYRCDIYQAGVNTALKEQTFPWDDSLFFIKA